MWITVCTGSHCAEKGAGALIGRFLQLAAENGFEGKLRIRQVMCSGNCSNGVSVGVGGMTYSVRPGLEERFFERQLKRRLAAEEQGG